MRCSHLHVFLDLLVLLLGGEELGLGERLPQHLLGHEELQLQERRHSAVLADEAGAVGVEMDCGRIHTHTTVGDNASYDGDGD